MISRFVTLAFICVVTLSIGCSDTDESRIESTVDDLVDAMNARDKSAAGALFSDGNLAAINAAGDSSAVYRLITIPDGGDFDADNVQATIIADRAQAQFDLTGNVQRSNEVVGKMTIRLGVDLERKDDGWQFVAGSDRMLSTY